MENHKIGAIGSFVAGWVTRASYHPTISVVECILFVVSLIGFLGLKLQIHIPDNDEDLVKQVRALISKTEENDTKDITP